MRKRIFACLILFITACTGFVLWTQSHRDEPVAAMSPGLDIWFLDVGQADAALISCGGKTLLIDGGNESDSQHLYSFLTKTAKVSKLDYVIATHPHEDHIGGLPAAFRACEVGALYTPVLVSENNRRFDLLIKSAQAQKVPILVPSVSDKISLGDAQIEFLSPAHDYPDINNLSIIVRITYENTSFLFTGDAETAAERDLIASGIDITSDVLKVGHHGASTSTSTDFLLAVYPKVAVISVGRGNKYGHPADDTMYFLDYYGIDVYRTDLDGMILCHSDGQNISFLTEHDVDRDTDHPTADMTAFQPTAAPTDFLVQQEATYIGNRKSKRFHVPACVGVSQMSETNKVFLRSREEAIEAGYVPCGSCHP